MRIHIFRRDRKAEEATKAKKEMAARELLFIAYKENLILEKYFGQTLEKSTYSWAEDKRKQIEAAIDRIRPYQSPVSRGLIHIQEKMLWFSIFTTLALLVLVNAVYARKVRRKAQPRSG
jgi:hypothetical protein